MTPPDFRECRRCHCLRPVKSLDEHGCCADWGRCREKTNGATGPQTTEGKDGHAPDQ